MSDLIPDAVIDGVVARVSAFVVSIVRTAVPMVVGWLLSLPVAPAVLDAAGIDAGTAAKWLYGLIMFALALGYYVLVRWLEQRWPKLGRLLGIPAKPVYIDPTGAPVPPPAAEPTVITSSDPGQQTT